MSTPTWQMHAGVDDYHDCYVNVAPDVRYTRAFGHTHPVEVTVTLDPDGRYLGWIDANGDEPTIIQPHPVLYGIQFPYGPDVEEQAGKGRTVHLRIEPADT